MTKFLDYVRKEQLEEAKLATPAPWLMQYTAVLENLAKDHHSKCMHAHIQLYI